MNTLTFGLNVFDFSLSPAMMSTLDSSSMDERGIPASPWMMRLSLVRVPVLSKQQTSTFPPKGIRKGSVQ